MKEIVIISPEGLEIANAYLLYGSIKEAAKQLCVPEHKAAELLNKRETKAYIDNIYLDTGYRNRNAIGALLDEMIASKIEEAQESGIYTSKDLLDLLTTAHKMRMEEIKAMSSTTTIKSQTNVQINDGGFGQGNYGKLMERIIDVKPQ